MSFLEVNTRVQVEHPVTEMTSGVDIVAEQFRIATGEELSFLGSSGADRSDPVAHGHAIEFRLNAEDVANGFVPCPGTVSTFEVPTGPGIRVDAGVRTGGTVPGFYDSLLGKLIVWGPTREVALRRATAALDEFRIEGVRTVLPFHRDIVRHPAFTADGPDARFGVYTDWVDTCYTPGAGGAFGDGSVEDAYTERTEISVEIDGRLHRVGIPSDLLTRGVASGGAPADAAPESTGPESAGSGTAVTAPFAGTVVAWKVEDGDRVEEGQAVATVEAMKMERTVSSPADGVLSITAQAGQAVTTKETLATVETEETAG